MSWPKYHHYTKCTACKMESGPMVSPQREPWVVGIFCCCHCRNMQNITEGMDRVELPPLQLELFPSENTGN
jgi:hypothetical protein